jgi:hypothetical protein
VILSCDDALIAAYNALRDPRYGIFVSMIPGYWPDLIDHPALLEKGQLPPAPSKVWGSYGLAMLRSDESRMPGDWLSPQGTSLEAANCSGQF